MPEIESITIPTFYDEYEYRPEPVRPPEPPAMKDGRVRVGIHTSIAGDLNRALETAHVLGCNALQIFSASPRAWPRRAELEAAAGTGFRARRAELALGPLVIHGNYLINLASPDRVLRARSIQAFHDELVRAITLGADYLVAHPGSARGAHPRQALQWVAEGIRKAARGLKLGDLQILLENTSGQGTSLGMHFSELKQIQKACPEIPLGVCLDTAHLLEAGYEIRTAEGLERTLQAIESTVGLASVRLLHVNDSKTPRGSRVDRHEHIGKGHIGLQAFARILNHPLLAGKALILETPIDRPGDDRRNVATVWKLVGGPPAGVVLPRPERKTARPKSRKLKSARGKLARRAKRRNRKSR